MGDSPRSLITSAVSRLDEPTDTIRTKTDPDTGDRAIRQAIPGGWALVAFLSEINGKETVTEIRVIPDDSPKSGRDPLSLAEWDRSTKVAVPAGGVTSSVVRGIRLQHMLDEQRSRMEVAQTMFAGRTEDSTMFVGPAKEGRGFSEAFYAEFAAAYVRLVDAGERRPAVRLAEQLGLKVRTVQMRLAAARRLGLLTGSPGKVGGELTSRALDQLGPAFNRADMTDEQLTELGRTAYFKRLREYAEAAKS